MDPERWQRVKQIVNEALEVDSLRRAAYLDDACRGDLALRGEVDSLLDHHQQASSGFLGRPAGDLSSPSPHRAVQSSRVGFRVGVYELLEEIGEGGMGVVYRAARADGQYEKQVAVKLVRRGYDTAAVVERFRHERQILASLDHPNIARLLDGGTTADLVPYLVMELIEGTPIDQYCDTHRLPVTQRLQLFRQVCAAVQYAHQRLVIHRDLKPSNVLVTKEGVPKLLDFGIAKILNPSASADVTMARPMTLAYASPEQIHGDPITVASDVYSLGVVLYHLLTGRSPYPPDARSDHDLARAICDTEPGRPSTVVLKSPAPRTPESGAPFNPEAVASSRERSPARLQRRLAGDLDDILLMALRKEPQRRYTLVEHLAEDIGRHLDGLPVTATKGSWRYRAAKFTRRHAIGVAASVAVVLAAGAGVVATAREARIARRQADIATIQKARAEKRFDDVRQLSDSLIFDVHDAIRGLPGATPARRLLLDRAVEYLDSASKDAAGEPDLERELGWGYQRLAVVQGSPSESNLGDLNAALASDRKALALFERVAAANRRNTIDQLNVAMMHRILAYSTLTQAAGRRDLDTAMAITSGLLEQGSTDPRVRSERSIEFQNLAFLQDAMGDRVHALESYRKNRDLKLDILRTDPNYRQIRRSLGMATVLLGSALARTGDRDAALMSMDEGIALYEAVPNEGDEINVTRELAIAMQKRGDVLLMNGDRRGALAIFRQAYRILAPMAKADPQNAMLQLDVAGMAYHEGRALTSDKQYALAVVKLRQAAQVFDQSRAQGRSADDSPRGPGSVYIWLGEACAGDTRGALQRYLKATALLRADLARSPDADTRCELAVACTKTAAALAATGDPLGASSAYREALDIVGEGAVPAHKDVPAFYVMADAYAGLADLAATGARKTQDRDRRSALLGEAQDLYEKSLSAWAQIPNPSRISPSGYTAGQPQDVAASLARVRQARRAGSAQ